MTSKANRKIRVGGQLYYWVLDNNTAYPANSVIRVHVGRGTRNILYIDPHAWGFEIRPQTIARAITFARKHGWNPLEHGDKLIVSMHVQNNATEDWQFILKRT